MKLKNKIVGGLLRMKNRQIRAERERSRALSESNSILSAYVASLIEERGGARVSREQIKNAIGKYTAKVISDGADYVISIIREGCEDGEDLANEKEKQDRTDVRG